MKTTKNVRLAILALTICSAFFFAGAKDAPSTTTEWIGHPVVSNNDPYTPSQGWIPRVEIGLRSDGVVVWRDTTKTTKSVADALKELGAPLSLPAPLPTFTEPKK